MRNWKIGRRITAGFVAVIAIAVLLGVLAYSRTLEIEKNENVMAVNYVPSIDALSQANTNNSHVLGLLLKHAASSDQREMEALEAQIGTLRERNAALYKQYEATPITDEERAMFAVVQANRVDFWKTLEDIRRLSRLGTPAANEQAQKLIYGVLFPVQSKLSDSVQDLLNFNVKGAKTNIVDTQNSVSGAKRSILFGLALAIVIAIPITLFIVRSITEPLAQVLAVLQKIETCDLSGSLNINTTDEMGVMAGALNAALATLNRTLEEVSESAAQTTSSSQQLAAAAESIASGAQEQAASLEETSASLEEITATVRQSADNAHQANQLASGSRDAAEKGRDVVSSAITAMTEINAASAKISDIISTIDEIAFQTNLLAVNAAVEAARAGEEGRGFAVVASEVRSLAQRSAGAAKEIKGLIQDSLKKVETGSTLVNKSGDTLEGIVGSVKRVTDIFGEIAAAASEQSTGIEQVNTAVTQMDQVTQSNSAQTEELSATAQTLSEQAGHLQEVVSMFTLRKRTGPGFHVRAAAPEIKRPASPRPAAAPRVTKPKAIPRTLEPVMTAVGGPDDSSFEEF